MISLRALVTVVIQIVAVFGLAACHKGMKYAEVLTAESVEIKQNLKQPVLHSAATKRLIGLRNGVEAVGDSSLIQAQYVSIARIDARYFVISNYVNLLLFDRSRSEICALKPSFSIRDERSHKNEAIGRVSRSEEIYNPTGVFAGNSGDLFVANYKGNNVLRGRVDVKQCTVNFFQSYSSQSSLGPENVFVDSEQGTFVSANYDAGTVTAFDIGSGREVWAVPIAQAHGVAIVGSRVFATGLRDRKIYELRLSDGGVVRSVGSLGWNPRKHEFLWPTSIFPTSDGELVVADAQSGFVTFLNPNDLSVVRYIGGNGPSDELFNYPYSATPVGNAIAVLQSSRKEIVFFDLTGRRIIERFSFQAHQWPVNNRAVHPFGSGWVGYINESGPRLLVRGKSYKLGFGNLHPDSNGPVLRVPDIGTLFNLGPYLYFLQGRSVGDRLSYFFSSSSTTLVSLGRERGRPDLLMTDRIPVDSWLDEAGDITSDQSALSQHVVLKRFDRVAGVLYSELDRSGWLAPKVVYSALDPRVAGDQISFERFREYLDKIFVSPYARAFKYEYDKCELKCSLDDLRSAAASYYKEIAGQAYANLDEYILVGMLSGFAESDIGHEGRVWSFDDCGKGKYYAGYGTTALETSNLNDYLSAESIDSSFICFSETDKRRFSLNGISFAWYSEREVPKRIEIYGVTLKGPSASSFLIKGVDVQGATTLGGYLFSSLKFDKTPAFDKYMIRVVQGGAQNRLILRGIFPEVRNDLEAKSNDPVEQLVSNVSRSIRYGEGVSKVPPEFLRTADRMREFLLRSNSVHCGNAAVILITALPRNLVWRYFQLEAFDGRIHVVVEVFDGSRYRTLDPTLGAIYECSVSALIDGSCNYKKEWNSGSINPVFDIYRGVGFFYGARITAEIEDYEGLVELYR